MYSIGYLIGSFLGMFLILLVIAIYLRIGAAILSMIADENSNWGCLIVPFWPVIVAAMIAFFAVAGIGFATYYLAFGWHKAAKYTVTIWGEVKPTMKVFIFYFWPISLIVYSVHYFAIKIKNIAIVIWQYPQNI